MPRRVNVEILDVIGPSDYGWIDEKVVLRQIEGLTADDEIHVRINSPGGSVFEGIGIGNVLKDSPANVIIRVDGIAASAASVIAMAGDRIEMPANTMLMIHNPQTIAMGESKDLRKTADVLDTIQDVLAETYAERGNKNKKHFINLMNEETWLTADQAVELGLADVVIRGNKTPPKAMTNAAIAFAKNHFSKLPPTAVAAFLNGAVTTMSKNQTTEVVNEVAAEETPAPVAEETPVTPPVAEESQEVAETPETPPVAEETPAEAPEETPAPVTAQVTETVVNSVDPMAAARAEMAKFTNAFGPTQAAVYFNEGLSFENALVRDHERLKNENKGLAEKAAAAVAAAGEETPVSATPADKKVTPQNMDDSDKLVAYAATLNLKS